MNHPVGPTPIRRTLETTPEGVVIRVRAQAGSQRNGVVGLREDEIMLCVTSPPEKGRANDAILKLLAKTLGIARSRVNLITGHTNRHKRFCVQGKDLDAVQVALVAALPPGE